ncbi:RDD family protein [Enterococcus thailandicus]|nr:RDD family protein [Enterococcus thailandicus]
MAETPEKQPTNEQPATANESKINPQPAVGPDKGFSQKVLNSFRKEELTEEQIKEKQAEWQQYTETPTEKKELNDFPTYFYAGFWIRFFAFLIDLLCIGAITRLTLGVASNFGWLSINDSYLSVYGLLGLVIYLSYFVLLTKLNHGQTLGKMIFGIRVISFDERKLSWSTVLVREAACRFILKFPLLFIGYIPTIFSQKKQHLGDYFSNTSVVTFNFIKTFKPKNNA